MLTRLPRLLPRLLLLGLGTIATSLAAAPTAQAAAPAAEARLFATEAEAIRACGSDTVVWLNKSTKVYHFKESRWYGKTKDGGYGCRTERDKAGDQAAKTSK